MKGTEERSQYRVLQSPQAKQEQINNALIRHSAVMRELKSQSRKKTGEASLAESIASHHVSQSQLHLQVVLGDEYVAEDMSSNIKKALVKSKLTPFSTFYGLTNNSNCSGSGGLALLC